MTYAHLPLHKLTPSPSNASRALRYKPDAMQSLAASIKANGVMQNLVARPLPASRLLDTFDAHPSGQRPEYEIVMGERRWTAAKMAGIDTIPVVVKAMTDEEALEAQLKENTERENIHPLDEADTYKAFQDNGHTIDSIAQRFHKSRRTIYNVLALLKITPAVRNALEQDRITASHAQTIATAPHDSLQQQCLDWLLDYDRYATPTTKSVRDLQDWMDNNINLPLKKATFNITDATLCPEAGSCKSCPKRTGYDPDLFAILAKDADTCTDPICYKNKSDAHQEKLLEKGHNLALANSATLLDKHAAEAITPYGYNHLLNYVDIDVPLDYIALKTPRQVLSKPQIASMSPVVLQHGKDDKWIVAVPKNALSLALQQQGLIPPATAKPDDDIDYSGTNIGHNKLRSLSPEATKRAEQDHLEKTVRMRIIDQVKALPQDTKDITQTILLQRICAMALTTTTHNEEMLLLNICGIQHADDIDHVTNPNLLGDVAISALVFDEIYNIPFTETFEDDHQQISPMCKLLGLDPWDISQQIRAQLQADQKANEAKAKRTVDAAADHIAATEPTDKPTKTTKLTAQKAAKPSLPLTPLAQPNLAVAGSAKQLQARYAKAAAVGAAKLSPSQAQLGIADAMQALDDAPDGAGQQSEAGQSAPTETRAATEPQVGDKIIVRNRPYLTAVQHKWHGKTGHIGSIWPDDNGDKLATIAFQERSGTYNIALPLRACVLADKL